MDEFTPNIKEEVPKLPTPAEVDARNLERLDLSRNAVSSDGLRVLRQAGVSAVANNPLTEQELADQEYLREGDFE